MNSSNNQSDLTSWSTTELADVLNISVSWLEKDRRKKDGIPYYRLRGRIRYDKKDVLDWIKANKKQMDKLRH